MPEQHEIAKSNKILRLVEVIERTGLSRSTIYDRIDPKSPRHDPTFPSKVKIGIEAVGWVESELENWLLSRIQANRPVPVPVQGTTLREEQLPETLSASKQELTQRDSASSEDLATVYELLEKHAKSGTAMPYKQVMTQIRLWPDLPKDRAKVKQILECVSRKSHLEGKGLLGVLVHENTAEKSRPGHEFFRLAKELGYSYSNQDVFVQEQTERLFEFYEQPVSKSKGGVLIWINSRGRNFLTRTQKIK